jgi:hypothetical protein
MGPGEYAQIVVGTVILAFIFFDLFQAVVLPRPSVYRLPLTSQILIRYSWRGWRWLGRHRRADKRENFLGSFGPAGLLMLLGFWSLFLMLGYGLIFNGLRDQIQPPSRGIWTSLYFSGGSLLPVGHGDMVAEGGAARVVALAESATGVILIALVISLVFSLYQSVQAREESVVSLDALAGAPPSGLQILETAAANQMQHRLEPTFDEWRRWSAAVLESHLAYPILFFFRSSHDNEAWLNSFGAVMDAATLLISAVEHESVGTARLMSKVGNHLVEDIFWNLGVKGTPDVGVAREEFDEALARLREAGYRCRAADAAWPDFVELRKRYAPTLSRLAESLDFPHAHWLGDRTYLPHRSSSRRPRRDGPAPKADRTGSVKKSAGH